MNPIQESKQELEASIRYAENAIDKAKQTIESMATYQEQTGREQALEEERAMLEKNVKYLRDENERLKREKEASSGPCGCQAYRDLEEKVATMPVIPKDVAIAIFRKGTLFGVEAVCDEIQGEEIRISESGYTGDFEVSFERNIDLDDHIDFEWVRSKVGDYDEDNVTANLEGLCAKNHFECRIHGVDDQEEKKND